MFRCILLLVAASSDSDIYMLEKGATTNQLKVKTLFTHSLIFAVVSVLMTFLGLMIGKLILNEKMVLLHEMITILIFLCISAIIFVRTFRKEKIIERLKPEMDLKTTLKQSILTGIDFLLIGVSLTGIGIATIYILFAAFLLKLSSSLSASCIGYYLGADYQKAFGYLSALIYFVVANIELISLVL